MKALWLPVLVLLLLAPFSLQARWIKDKVLYTVADAGDVEFSHYRHLEILGNNCPSCHNDLFHIVTTKNPEATMKAMEEGKSCGSCHDGNKAFTVADNCDVCHAP